MTDLLTLAKDIQDLHETVKVYKTFRAEQLGREVLRCFNLEHFTSVSLNDLIKVESNFNIIYMDLNNVFIALNTKEENYIKSIDDFEKLVLELIKK